MTVDWTKELLDQFSWHWDTNLRPRLDGLTDEEYLWEPVEGCWNIRPRGEATTPMAVGAGDHVMDYAIPEPSPAPVTTIAWRIGHLLVGVLGQRNASHFGGPATTYPTFDYPARADDALEQLDVMVAQWVSGVTALSAMDLEKPCGEDGFESAPMGALVLHIHREMIHHGAEIALLRDLYTWRGAPQISSGAR